MCADSHASSRLVPAATWTSGKPSAARAARAGGRPAGDPAVLNGEALAGAADAFDVGVLELEARLDPAVLPVEGGPREVRQVERMHEHPRGALLDHEVFVVGRALE